MGFSTSTDTQAERFWNLTRQGIANWLYCTEFSTYGKKWYNIIGLFYPLGWIQCLEQYGGIGVDIPVRDNG